MASISDWSIFTFRPLLDQPLNDIPNDIPVDDEEVKTAPIEREGLFGYLLDDHRLRTSVDWEPASRYQQQLDISENQLCKAYSQATSWTQELFSQTS